MDFQEITKHGSAESSYTQLYNLYCTAKLNLVLCRFGEAIEICRQALSASNNYDDCNKPESSFRKSQLTVSFVVIAVQAFAELNQWHNAVAFADQAFETAENFPPEVLELCLGLLVKATQFEAASKLAEKWLLFERNFAHSRYLEVLELYIKHILVPEQYFEKARAFVGKSNILTCGQKQGLINFIVAAQQREEEKESSTSTASIFKQYADVNKQSGHFEGPQSRITAKISLLMQKLQSLYTMITNSHTKKTKSLVRLFMLFFFVYALLTASGYHGLTRDSGIYVLWEAIQNLWKTLFNPYHIVPVQQ